MIYFLNEIRNAGVKFFPAFLAIFVLTLPLMAGWTQRQKITSVPRGVGAQFGNAVAINGNTMVVGARFDSTTASQAGAAFVYVLNGNTWIQQAKLLASDGAAIDKFGYSVAISEDTIVVGAYQDDAAFSNSGSAYVFVRNGTTWTQQQKLTSPDGSADDEFGNAVGITGEVIVVGSHFANLPSGGADTGSAYIFQRSGTTWTFLQKLIPTPGSGGPILGDLFGESVAVGGSKIAIGAAGDDTPETRAGAVYVFVESVGGTYVLQQKLFSAGSTNGDNFGNSVAMEGNTLVAGAREDTPIAGQTACGSAYVFEFNGATWTSQGQLIASDGGSFDRFGWSVAVSDGVIAVGARGDDTAAGADAGSAYVFTRSGTTWTEVQKLAPADPFNGDRFGESVALSFGRLVVGAAEKALTAPNGQGAAYSFAVHTAQARADFDGDGRTDASVFRSSSGWWFILRNLSTQEFTSYQWGVSTDRLVPGDYDADGKADVAVYRPSNGGWYILNSNGTGYNTFSWGVSGDVPSPGDYDGDGRTDVAVYRPSTSTWYILKSSGGWHSATWGVAGDVPLTGDFDGDGVTDISVWRPSNGTWYLNRSTAGFVAITWGVSTDRPVYADYDGDNKDDIAVWRPSSGTWYVLRSSDNGYYAATWGANGDIPVPGDYDGDHKNDIGVYRNGIWYLNRSTLGFIAFQFGIASDEAIPAVYLP